MANPAFLSIPLAYGKTPFDVSFPAGRTDLIEPCHAPGLPDERLAFKDALAAPIGAPALREWIKPGSRVCIVFTDITRATPNDRIIPWLLEELAGHPRALVTLVNGLGTHRPNTAAELETMLTPAVIRGWRVVNHEPENPSALMEVGRLDSGRPALINRLVAEADVRILTGFIEPHFFAGFSGGPKAIFPGTAGLDSVMDNHGASPIAHPGAAFGITKGNPIWEEMARVAAAVGPSFLINVTLNERRQITGVYAGELFAAHRAGCEAVKASAMRAVDREYDVVVTTNSGYPLDLNLYQGVKGLSAGARIVKPGGLLILACECREGVPAGSPFDCLLRSAAKPEAVLQAIGSPGFRAPEQWQAQILALIRRRARVHLFSSLADEAVRAAHMEPCRDIAAAVARELAERGDEARVAVLPQGPLTIPYFKRAP
jgi:nickel-dependent lactate racemase